jgi:predicted membrane protein
LFFCLFVCLFFLFCVIVLFVCLLFCFVVFLFFLFGCLFVCFFVCLFCFLFIKRQKLRIYNPNMSELMNLCAKKDVGTQHNIETPGFVDTDVTAWEMGYIA